jgi:hypothetical protein
MNLAGVVFPLGFRMRRKRKWLRVRQSGRERYRWDGGLGAYGHRERRLEDTRRLDYSGGFTFDL